MILVPLQVRPSTWDAGGGHGCLKPQDHRDSGQVHGRLWGRRIPRARRRGAFHPQQGVSSIIVCIGWLSMLTQTFTAPAWGSAVASGSRTPAWRADGSRTSNPYDGSRTAYGGSRTPAWNAGARTPYDSSSGSSGFDAFAAGSRTPAWGAANPSGSRTPAWNANVSSSAANNTSSSSTSKGFDAPTPGGDYTSAPTPGAYASAPTPGASAATAPTPRWPDSAPTPAALNAPTPGAYAGGDSSRPYDAPTPAVGGDDGGPRYEEGTPSP